MINICVMSMTLFGFLHVYHHVSNNYIWPCNAESDGFQADDPLWKTVLMRATAVNSTNLRTLSTTLEST